MIILILIFIINLFLLLPTYYLTQDQSVALTIIIIIINFVILNMYSVVKLKDKSLVIIIFIALLLRIVILLLNHLVGVTLPHDGMDTEYYNSRAINLIPNILSGDIDTFYPIVIGIIYFFTDNNRLFAQFFNIILFFGMFIYLNRIMILLMIRRNLRIIVLGILAIFPQSLIFSVILLRENIIAFFVTVSLYYSIKYIKNYGVKNLYYSLFFILLASASHAGTIALIFPLIIIMTLYSPRKNKFDFSITNYLKAIVFVTLISIILYLFNDIFLTKFINLAEQDDSYKRLNISMGNSAYLTSIVISNPFDIVLYSPLKTLYFYISPVPLDWKSVIDIVTFFLDSSLYLYALFLMCKNFKKLISNPIGLFLILAIIIFGVIFGMGTYTAGTAIRHRYKIIILVFLFIGFNKGVINNENFDNR